MKIILNKHISGAKGSFVAGDEIEVSDNEALRYIDKGIAIPKTKKEYDAVLKKIEKEKEIEEQKQKELQALLLREELEGEKEKLLKRVQEIDEILESGEDVSKTNDSTDK